jgi:flagellar motor switch/type III secretory pathway protein FliN
MTVIVSPLHKALGLKLDKSRFEIDPSLSDWFSINFEIDSLLKKFWGVRTKSKLITVSQDVKDEAWNGLVTEWDAFASVSGQFRLNRALVHGLLNLALGESPKPFSLKNVSELEFALFENFFVEFENTWKDFWRVSEPNAQGPSTYLIWLIELGDEKLGGLELGSLAIGVPAGISKKEYKAKRPSYDFRASIANWDFPVPIDISVGKTSLTVKELSQLELDDILIFEDSHISRALWEKNEMEKVNIRIELPTRDNTNCRKIYYDDLIDELGQKEMNEEQDLHSDILTDLPVELTAQFKSVSMPLRKIVELEEGGILPLGLLLDSQMVLMAPGNKAIAQGELVVVGNQFGLKISKTNLGNRPVLASPIHLKEERTNTPQATRNSYGTHDMDSDEENEPTSEKQKWLDEQSPEESSLEEDLEELEDLY